MTLTEARLEQILDNKLLELRNDLVASFACDLMKEVNTLKATMNTIKSTANSAMNKAKSCEDRLLTLEQAEPLDITAINTAIYTHTTYIQSLKDNHVARKATVVKYRRNLVKLDRVI